MTIRNSDYSPARFASLAAFLSVLVIAAIVYLRARGLQSKHAASV